jgi:hypothetical protein
MRFWERIAIWAVLGVVFCYIIGDSEGTYLQDALPPILWVVVRGAGLMVSLWCLFASLSQRFPKFALWGGLVCRWFAHCVNAFFVFYFALGIVASSTSTASLSTVTLWLTVAVAVYPYSLITLDITKLRKSNAQTTA